MHLTDLFDKGIGAFVLALIVGSYTYTFKATQNKALKDDIHDLRDRVNMLYLHLLNKNLDEELKKKNEKLE